MIVDSAANYAFTGGALTADAASAYGAGLATDATGKLTKLNTGTLTLSTASANTFTGGIDLDAGALALGGTTNVSSATALVHVATNATLQMLNGGALNAANLALDAGSTLTGNGTVRYDKLTLAGAGMVNAAIPAGSTLILSSTTISDSALQPFSPSALSSTSAAGILKTGAGTLQLDGAGAFGNSSVTQADEGIIRVTGFATATATVIPGGIIPLVSGSLLVLTSYTIPITAGQNIVVPTGTNIIPTGDLPTVSIPGTTYPSNAGSIVIPSCTVTIGGEDTVIASSTITFPYSAVTVPAVTATIAGPLAIVPTSSFTIPNYYMAAATVAQNVVLNGGTFALSTTGVAATGATGGNDKIASNWIGFRFIQGDNAAASVITGVNDIVYIGSSGTFAPQLTAGLHVDINPDDGGVVVLGNTANNFTGIVIAGSGTLQVTAASQLGSAKTASNTQIALNGGVVEFAAPMNFAGDIAVRSGINTVVVDDGMTVQWGRIYRDASYTPGSTYVMDDSLPAASGTMTVAGAAFVKAGAGTMTLTGQFQANALEVDAGRFIITASNGLPVVLSASGQPSVSAPVVVKDGAVLQLSQTLAAGAASTYQFARGYYTPSVSGTIVNAFCGSGTLEITANKNVLTSGDTDIASINITGASTGVLSQASSLSPRGTITVDQGTLALGITNQTLGNVILNNGATMGFVMTPATITLTGSNGAGNYTYAAQPRKTATLASLTATGAGIPNLWFNTNIAAASADHLTINTPVTGTFNINVVNGVWDTTGAIDPNTLPKARVNLELINAPASPNGVFIIADSSKTIDIGLYKYAVTGTTATNGGASAYTVNITGNGDMSQTAAAIYTAAAMLPLGWFSELDSLTQRLGDLHLQTPDATGRAVSPKPPGSFSAWTRGFGEKINFNRTLTGTKFGERHLGGEAGVDYEFGAAWHDYAGAFLGYGQSQRDYNDPTDASNESTFGGIYNTLVSPGGWYVDAVLKLNRFRNRYTVTDPSTGAPASADYHSWATGGSLEIGKRQPIKYENNEVWFVTPSLQVARTSLAGKDYALANGVRVNLDSGATTLARAGVTFGRDIETTTLGTITAYLKAYYGHQWTTGGDVLITLPDGTAPVPFSSKTKGHQYTGGAGLSWQFTKATQVYFDYEITQTDYYLRPYGLNLGLRHLW